jgi:hypothetical protein
MLLQSALRKIEICGIHKEGPAAEEIRAMIVKVEEAYNGNLGDMVLK